MNPFDIQITGASLTFLQVATRVPLKFGSEVLTSVTCARVSVSVERRDGHSGEGWGETPLSVQWVWPSATSYEERHLALQEFSELLLNKYKSHSGFGHALELGYSFVFELLPTFLKEYNESERNGMEPLPWLGALVCASAFDLALHDAYGMTNDLPTYQSYDFPYLNLDLSHFIESNCVNTISFEKKTPSEFLVLDPDNQIPVWHLVGGLDPLSARECTGSEPRDGYPIHLEEWIERDGLNCLKIKLRGNDSHWDYSRLVAIGKIANEMNVDYLTTDFNCTVTDPSYVNQILDQLKVKESKTWDKIIYVEQPFPYDLEKYGIKVHSLSERKPLFMDESAHDWKHVRLGLELGWTGVALKTCKTQTGALLSLCWAKAHGMDLMVQDLTNPMLAQIPHVLLGAHAGTIMGVESNGMQFYPEASLKEALIHPGIYERRNGMLDLSTLKGPGFGYQMELG